MARLGVGWVVRGEGIWILQIIKRTGGFQGAWSGSDLMLSLMFSFCG